MSADNLNQITTAVRRLHDAAGVLYYATSCGDIDEAEVVELRRLVDDLADIVRIDSPAPPATIAGRVTSWGSSTYLDGSGRECFATVETVDPRHPDLPAQRFRVPLTPEQYDTVDIPRTGVRLTIELEP
jgi:hypothetical protein